MGERLSGRARAIIAVVGAALLIPLGATAPAGAATPEPKNSDADVRAVELGKPEKIRAFKSETTSSDVGTAAVDCSLGQANHDRVTSCSYYRIPVIFTINEQPAGTANLYSKATAELDPRNRYQWRQRVELRLTDPSTPAAYAVTGRVGYDCNYCDVDESGPQLLTPGTTRTYDFTMSSPGRQLVNDSIIPYATLDAPGFDEGSAYIGEVFRPRCDNTPRVTPVRFGGCVYPDVPPIWQVSVRNPRVDAVAWHIDWAQRNLNQPWGVPGSRYPLHRTFDQALQIANRNVACGPDVPRPPNRPDLSCDEYPFAQTYEGASRNPDYSCHFLDRQDNSREGSLRRSFLNSLRTLENDAFYVEVTGKESATAPAPPSVRGPVGCGSD
ncbi:hypothetical protein ACFV80_24560 [Streptomyces sp. NPDC059862]|uniref:NucA/NucB deoxyribonuclease domain-containing protein n=1 Tax=Streptomyces sp. NPDC059862 TaxID=3346975 RepID=UPI003669CDE5